MRNNKANKQTDQKRIKHRRVQRDCRPKNTQSRGTDGQKYNGTIFDNQLRPSPVFLKTTIAALFLYLHSFFVLCSLSFSVPRDQLKECEPKKNNAKPTRYRANNVCTKRSSHVVVFFCAFRKYQPTGVS